MIHTPEKITSLNNNEIFVFGSNLAGRHGKGAALQAVKFGAKYGKGFGLFGQTFAIPTKDENLKILPLHKIEKYIKVFLIYATKRQDLLFIVTKIGCGLAGYTTDQIKPFFRKSLKNVILPKEFNN